jgi:hypothetical protein
VRIYLDACCLSRLTDDQSQARIREEAEAVEHILSLVRRGTVDLISSDALEDEVRRIPLEERRREVATLLLIATGTAPVDDGVEQRARELVSAGYGAFDALHVAAAESASVDVLFSTDDRLIKRAARGVGGLQIPVRNPVSWIQEQRP